MCLFAGAFSGRQGKISMDRQGATSNSSCLCLDELPAARADFQCSERAVVAGNERISLLKKRDQKGPQPTVSLQWETHPWIHLRSQQILIQGCVPATL